jgi:hypothetical protein
MIYYLLLEDFRLLSYYNEAYEEKRLSCYLLAMLDKTLDKNRNGGLNKVFHVLLNNRLEEMASFLGGEGGESRWGNVTIRFYDDGVFYKEIILASSLRL